MTTLTRKALREFWQLRGQALAIAFVLIGGVATLVMMVSNYRALSDTQASYYDEYRFADVFSRVKRAPLDLRETLAQIPGVRDVDLRVSASARLGIEGYRDPITGLLISLPDQRDSGLNRLFLREGRLPFAQRSDEVVVTETFASAHTLRPGDVITATMNGHQQRLTVVGIGLSPEFIYAIAPGELLPDFERFGILWLNRPALAAAFDLEGAFNDLAVSLYPDATAAAVVTRLDRLLTPYGGTGAYDRSLHMSHRLLSEELEQIRVMTWMFCSIFLLVTAFLLNMVIGRVIETQREQIAVLKAFGYHTLEIARHYALLVGLLLSVGLVPGVALGAWLGQGLADIYQQFYGFPYLRYRVDLDTLALALLFTAGAGLLGAWSALTRALRLAPALAMRPEAPPIYRRTLIERLGLSQLLPPSARMILRSLERRPLRALFSVLGIGLAIGILVMSRFQAGAIHELIALQFNLMQRDDLNVVFNEPTTASALDELRAIPGLHVAEPYRSVAVELRHEHRLYRGTLLGLSDSPELRQVLDAKQQVLSVPKAGVLLTDWLAETLHLDVGDRFWVTALEGHRDSWQVELAGTTGEYLGVNSYADIGTVNRWMREDRLISGAWLSLSASANRTEVIETLRERPWIAAISDRQALIASLRQTMSESILLFGIVATVMASSIAIGVVYNAARIALAERSRDLASLRVLGYTTEEIKQLLGGELMLLTALAVLPGIGLGILMSLALVVGFRSELYRIPLMLSAGGFAFALLVVFASAALATLWVERKLEHLDLVSALKTKE